MNNIKNRNIRWLFVILVLLVCGSMIFLLNLYTPMYGDDYNYSFIIGVYPWTRMTSITQLPLSMYNHFFMAKCGKIFTNGLAQAFLLLPAYCFDIINTLSFFLMVVLVGYHVTGNLKKISLKLFLAVFALLIIETPSFGQSFLWLDGASNYLYGPSFVLLYLIPYRRKLGQKNRNNRIVIDLFFSGFMFILGVVAGWTNENTSVALSIMIIGFIVLYRYRGLKINIWNVTGLIGAITGLCFLIFGPGEQERLEAAGETGNIVAWAKRFVFISVNFVEYMQLILLALVAVIAYLFIKKQKNDYSYIAVYGVGALASIYSMVASPIFPDRTWSGPLLLLIIVLGLLIRTVEIEETYIIKVAGFLFAFVIMIGIGGYINGYFAIKNAYVTYVDRIALIEEAQAEGAKTVTVPIIRGKSRFLPYQYGGDITDNPDFWLNHSMAEYYGFDEVIGK